MGSRIKLGFYSTVCQGFSVTVVEPLRVRRNLHWQVLSGDTRLEFFKVKYFQKHLSFCPRGGGDVWQRVGGVHGKGGHAWQRACMGVTGGMHGMGVCVAGACMAGGVCRKRDGHCSGRYASYWNAFLLI